MTFNRHSYDLGIITDLKPAGKIAVMLSNGLDSKVLLELLKLVHDDITTINLIRPTGRDLTAADINMELIAGEFEYQRVCDTIAYNIIPQYDQVWCGENAVPDIEWFKQHDDIPTRGSYLIDGNYFSPFLFLDKGHIIDLAKTYSIDVSHTISCIVEADTHCGECWFCKEREWGFNVNNLEVEW